jgi:hypothetical protein
LNGKVAAPGLENRDLGICRADHAALSIRES